MPFPMPSAQLHQPNEETQISVHQTQCPAPVDPVSGAETSTSIAVFFMTSLFWGNLGSRLNQLTGINLSMSKRGQKTFLSLRIFQGFRTTVPRTQSKNKHVLVFCHTKLVTLSFTTQRAANTPIETPTNERKVYYRLNKKAYQQISNIWNKKSTD